MKPIFFSKQSKAPGSLQKKVHAYRKVGVLAVLLAASACVASASAGVIFEETFSGSTDPLNGAAPDVRPEGSAATWTANSVYLQNGDFSMVSGGASAWLPYDFSTPGVYKLESVFQLNAGSTAGDYMGIAFTQKGDSFTTLGFGTANNMGGPNAAPSFILRETGNYLVSRTAAFGNVLANSGATDPGPFKTALSDPVKISFVLNTTGVNYTLDAYINDTQLDLNGDGEGLTYTYVSNPVLTGVGFGTNGSASGQFQSFSLTVVPEPSILAMLVLGAGTGVMAGCKKSKGLWVSP